MEKLVSNLRAGVLNDYELMRTEEYAIIPQDGRYFLQFDITVNLAGEGKSLERFIGWAHPQLKYQLLDPRVNLFIDATFKTTPCPKEFSQTLILMYYDWKADLYIPVYYVLMTSKTTEAYWQVLQQIIASCRWELKALTVTCDFETALINAVRSNFPEAHIVGCFFHWKQALRKKLRDDLKIDGKLVTDFMAREDLLNSLTVINPENILRGIAYIRKILHPIESQDLTNFNKFWTYFLDYWCNKDRITTWNVHNLATQKDRDSIAINRTNNSLERFNSEMNQELNGSHPSLLYWITTIKKLSIRRVTELNLSQLGAFNQPNPRTEVSWFDIPDEFQEYMEKDEEEEEEEARNTRAKSKKARKK